MHPGSAGFGRSLAWGKNWNIKVLSTGVREFFSGSIENGPKDQFAPKLAGQL